MQNVVIVGGTGMLAAAAREIAKRAGRVTLVSRSPQSLAREIGAEALPMDWTRDESVSAALAALGKQDAPDLLITWLHERGMRCLPRFEALLALGARSIRVHGSAAGDPKDGIETDPAAPRHVLRQHIVLGWITEPNGGRRWLTHPEISAGVLEAADDPGKRAWIVGELG